MHNPHTLDATPFALSTWRIALGGALLALSATGAQAEASDDELQRVKLYGTVTIAEDKLDSWGPWSNFEAPASGNSPSNSAPVLSTADPYRPLAQLPTGLGLACAGGSLCGFGAIYAAERSNNSQLELPATATIFFGTVVTPDAQAPLLPQVIGLRSQALGAGAPALFPESGDLDREISMSEGYYVSYSRQSGTETPTGGTSEHYQVSGDGYQQAGNPISDQVAQGMLNARLAKYVNATGEGGRYSSTESLRGGPVVLGFTSTDADMAALRASNATATYFGSTSFGYSPVRLEVQFGAGTWQGSWNNGVDGKTYSTNTTNQIGGQVGFTASGTISGVNITSTSVGTNDVGATVSGFVRGAFFGPQAAAAAGVVDITKTNPGVAVQPDRVLSAPSAVGVAVPQAQVPSGYTNARHVDTFIAVTRTIKEQ